MHISVNHIKELSKAAQQILAYSQQERIFLFYGEMGAGKTTLINEVCKALGVKDHTSSPTFSIVNQYQLQNGSVFHFDFYRLKNQTEALDLGYEDYFYSGEYCLVEWSERIPDLLPSNFLKLEIKIIDEQRRVIHVDKIKST